GDLDILMGDVSCSPLYSIINLRTNNNPLFRGVDSLWPAQAIAAMSFKFPASYNIDIDNNGVDELIVSTNFTAYEDFDEDFQNSVWLYRQSGANWIRQEKNWLQNTQIDVGSNAHPALADIDADGDLDLVIGTKARVFTGQNPRATLTLFRNIGTTQNPIFNFETEDWLSISALNLRFLKPVFADVNGDGAKDLLFSANPSSFNGVWRVFVNQSLTGAYQFTVPSIPFNAPLVTQIPGDGIAPFDYDNDGDLDFLVGRDGGYLNLVLNTGTVNTPNYQIRANDFGRLFRQAYFELNPCVADFNGDGNPDLITGNSSGHLRFYNNVRAWQSGQPALIPDSSLLMDPNSTVAQAVSLGGYLAPASGDLNGDGWPDLVIGLRTGGIKVLYNSSLSITGNTKINKTQKSFQVYPNPGSDLIKLEGIESGNLEILDLQGRLLMREE
ncbi:MAG: VCBS repeat-containing protein, partial [Sphingobacteriia bacterium]|nr:VCBS repeat-containing protein [Sphingobacteriia bacterium]